MPVRTGRPEAWIDGKVELLFETVCIAGASLNDVKRVKILEPIFFVVK